MSTRASSLRPITIAATSLFIVGCGGSSSSTTKLPADLSIAAAVLGPIDTHCEMNDMEVVQTVGLCMPTNDAAPFTVALSAADGGASSDADGSTTESDTQASVPDAATAEGGADTSTDDGGAADAGAVMSQYGATMYNSSGSDDDCKYNVNWQSTKVMENVGVTFYMNALRRADGQPAKGANVVLEVFLNSTHPTPTNNIPNTDLGDGSYLVGPVQFDAAGMWTVRFHLYEICSDDPQDSPHGHAAFYVNVP
jgi:hypothetical protein